MNHLQSATKLQLHFSKTKKIIACRNITNCWKHSLAIPVPKDYSWSDFVTLMSGFGFYLDQSGGGSHCKFVYEHDEALVINAFRPHPDPVLPVYYIKQIKTRLKELGHIK